MFRVLVRSSGFVCALFAFSLVGCSAVRFSSTLRPSPDNPPAVGSTTFSIAAVEGSIDRGELMQTAMQLYPGLFSEEWTAVPLIVRVQETQALYAGWAILVGLFTLGTVPCPQTARSDYVVATAATDAEGARVCDSSVDFAREDVTWMTLFTPFGLIPVCGSSDIERASWVDMDGVVPYTQRSHRYSLECIVEAVVTVLRNAEAAKLQEVAQARRDRLQEVVLNGKRCWSFLAPAFSEGMQRQERADLYHALFYREQPMRTTKPTESVLVARRGKDGRWQTVPAYVRSAETITAACALLENGTPARLVLKEVPEPPLEDFIALPAAGGDAQAELASIRWSNHALIQVKNRTLPRMLRERPATELIELATKIENVILDLNMQAELANDQAQRLV